MCDWQLWFSMTCLCCAAYVTNSSSPSTDPWGTPQVSLIEDESSPLSYDSQLGMQSHHDFWILGFWDSFNWNPGSQVPAMISNFIENKRFYLLGLMAIAYRWKISFNCASELLPVEELWNDIAQTKLLEKDRKRDAVLPKYTSERACLRSYTWSINLHSAAQCWETEKLIEIEREIDRDR